MKFFRRRDTASREPFGGGVLRFALLLSRFIQWASAGVVVGICSYYIHDDKAKSEHIVYEEIIACTTVGLYLLPVMMALVKRITWHLLPLDLVFSYLWLTSFIFEAEDYNWHSCKANSPPGALNCSLKWALEALTFTAFSFTFFSGLLQATVWIREGSVVGLGNANEKIETTNGQGHVMSGVTDDAPTTSNNPV